MRWVATLLWFMLLQPYPHPFRHGYSTAIVEIIKLSYCWWRNIDDYELMWHLSHIISLVQHRKYYENNSHRYYFIAWGRT